MTTEVPSDSVPSAAASGPRIAALDGIRGIAILLVLTGHVYPRLWPVAACGVTVFFALSGYLITGLLLREKERDGRVYLPRFYLRRIFRLAPTLLLVLSVTVIWCTSWGLYHLTLARDVRMTLLYTANWGIERGGFTLPLSQMWSLSVEEQFYLLWPLLVVLLGARRPRLALAAGILGLVSLGWRLVQAGISLEVVYYGSICVAFALLAGCAVACLEQSRTLQRKLRPWTRLGAAPMLVAVPLFAAVSVTAPFPQGWIGAIGLPVVAACTALALPGCSDSSWLAWAPLTWFGGISYALYLWQTPIEYNHLGHGPEHASPAWLVLALAIPLAWATTRFFERPITRWGHRLSLKI